MGLKITVNISDDEYKQIKELYEKDKKKVNNKDMSFDEYLENWISFAIKTQIQLSFINDKMSNFSSSLFDGFNFADLKFSDKEMNDVTNMVNSFFNNSVNKESSNKSKDNQDDEDKEKSKLN